MHLVDDLVLRILKVLKSVTVTAGDPAVSTSVGVTLDKDVLRGGAGLADAVNGSLVESSDDRVIHVVVLVVGVEDDKLVAGEALSELGPPSAELGTLHDVAVVAAVVVGVKNGIFAPVYVRYAFSECM